AQDACQCLDVVMMQQPVCQAPSGGDFFGMILTIAHLRRRVAFGFFRGRIQCVMCLAAERIPCRRRPELFHSINLLPELVTALRRNLLTSALAHYAVISYALAGLSHARSRDNQMAKLHRGSSARSQSVRHFWHRGSAALASSTVKPFCISRPNWPV